MNGNQILIGEELYLKIQTLKELKVDKKNWMIFYVDEQNGDKWVKGYPQSEYHCGGAPQLRLLKYFPWEK